VKFYYGIKGTSLEDADAASEKMGKEVLAMIDEIM
jgi:phosphoglucomutase